MSTSTDFNRVVFLVTILFALLIVPTAWADICRVDDDSLGGDGSGWDDSAYTYLQDALTNSSCTEIWVAAGAYYPDRGTAQIAGDRNSTFQLVNGVAIYGGFAGTETNRTERDWETNITVLSGDLDGNDINTDGNFIAETAADIVSSNVYHVVTGSGINETAVLDGVVITAGEATGEYPDSDGGGIFNSYSSPTLANVTFSGNSASDGGGGIANVDNSSPTLTNVTFSGNTANGGGAMFNRATSPTLIDVYFISNTANSGGGGMYNKAGSAPTLTDVTFRENTALGNTGFITGGGGMYNAGSSPILTDVTFLRNEGISYGGGMLNDVSSPTLTNVTFSGNTAEITGGGIHNDTSSPTLINVSFLGNTAASGGGMSNFSSSPILTNVVFSGNMVDYNGGGMSNNSSSPTLTNATFSGNTAGYEGGGIFNLTESYPTLTNVILWGDSAGFGYGSEISNVAGEPTISFSLIEGSYPSGSWDTSLGIDGGANLDADPLFVRDPDPGADGVWGSADDDYGDLRLLFGSPAIDAGDNTAVPPGVTTDRDGYPRLVNDVDMGAYEFDSDSDGIGNHEDNCPTIYNPAQTDDNGDGYGDACVESYISPSVSIGENPIIGTDSEINKDVSIGDNVIILKRVKLNKDVKLGDKVIIGNDSTIDQGVVIDNKTTIGDDTTINRESIIEKDVTIGNNVKINRNVVVKSGAIISDNTVIEKKKTIPATK